tara:strand:- start:1235 stop:2209 length:975 start_codon:yes stop_codon:yes gene_type:complete
LVQIYNTQEALSKRKRRKLRKREKKGKITPEQQAKLDAHRNKKEEREQQKLENKQAKEEQRAAEAEEMRQKALAEMRQRALRGELDDIYAEAAGRAYARLFEYRKQKDKKDNQKRTNFLSLLYPHTVVDMNYDNNFKGKVPNWWAARSYNWNSEKKRRRNKLPFDKSKDWTFSNVSNKQKQVDFYPYRGKMTGPITIDGREETTYNDRLRAKDKAELVDVTINKKIVNRPLDKSVWQEVAKLFPTDMRSWEKEEPGTFDPSLYMTKKERKRYKKQQKKERKKEKKEEKRQAKLEKRRQRELENQQKNNSNFFLKFFEDLFKNIG